MGLIEILFDIAFSIIGAVFELIFGIIGTIIQYFWLPILIIIAIWLIYLYIKVKRVEINAMHVLKFDDGVGIGYETEPPNFRPAFSDELGMRNACGTCKHCSNIGSEEPVCVKHGVKYKGRGCLDKTVCDDYKNVLFD